MSNTGFTNAIPYVNIAVMSFGCLVCLVIIVCILMSDTRRERLNRLFIRIPLCTFFLLISDIVAWALDKNPARYAYVLSHIANFFVYALSFVVVVTVSAYLEAYIARRTDFKKWFMRGAYAVCTVSLIILIASQYLHLFYYIDENNVYSRMDGFWISQICGGLYMFVNFVVLIAYRKVFVKREFLLMLTYVLIPVIAVIMQLINPGLATVNIATIIAALFTYISIHSEQLTQLRTTKEELAENRISIMISQIQPHFLYNSLSVIRHLCRTDPAVAEETVLEFSEYLRENMDSLTITEPIPFDRELKHVQTYMSIEKKRFGDNLNVEYDITVDSFMLPPLTVQPIVENAVRHGVTKRENGGKIVISTRENPIEYLITITDDGAGYNPQRHPADKKSHVGISNVRSRLESMCGGSLSIQSVPGSGTTVIISLPKETKAIKKNDLQ